MLWMTVSSEELAGVLLVRGINDGRQDFERLIVDGDNVYCNV